MMISMNNMVAITPLPTAQIKTEVVGAIAKASNRYTVIEADLVMDYIDPHTMSHFKANSTKVLIKNDVSFTEYNKHIYTYNDLQFILVPISLIIGFKSNEV